LIAPPSPQDEAVAPLPPSTASSGSEISPSSEAGLFTLPVECRAARLLIFDLFTGMDGLGHALDSLGTADSFPDDAVCLMFEVSLRCRKLLAFHRVRPGVILSSFRDRRKEAGSALVLGENPDELFRGILSQLPELSVILTVSGSPCVGFSRARSSRQGIRDPESSKLWTVPVALSRLRLLTNEMFITPVQIIFLVENVDMSENASDIANRDALSRTFGVEPVLLRAGYRCMTDRLRQYWTNLKVRTLLPTVLDVSLFLEDGWRPLWEFPSGIRQPDKRFCTFLRPFNAGQPPEFPADYRRLPLHCYSDRGLVYRPDASPDDLKLLADLVKHCVRIDTRDLRTKNSPCLLARGRLTAEIHIKGGDRFLRPLSGAERNRCLGFPSGASSLPEDETSEKGRYWKELEMSGNAFAVPVISHILEPVAAFLLRVDHPIPEVLPGFPDVNSKEEAILSLLPSTIYAAGPSPVFPLPSPVYAADPSHEGEGNICRRPS
jgi:hypothetical protein